MSFDRSDTALYKAFTAPYTSTHFLPIMLSQDATSKRPNFDARVTKPDSNERSKIVSMLVIRIVGYDRPIFENS